MTQYEKTVGREARRVRALAREAKHTLAPFEYVTDNAGNHAGVAACLTCGEEIMVKIMPGLDTKHSPIKPCRQSGAMVRVTNRRTGREAMYALDPVHAVISARRQFDQSDFETWRVGYFNMDIKRFKTRISCGDWTVRTA